jgi:hypothetical protein
MQVRRIDSEHVTQVGNTSRKDLLVLYAKNQLNI